MDTEQNEIAWREMTEAQKNKIGRLKEGAMLKGTTLSLLMNPFSLPDGWVSAVFLRDGEPVFVCGIDPEGCGHS